MPRASHRSARNTDALLRDVVQLFLQAQRALTACCSDATTKECQALLLLGQRAAPPSVQEFAELMSLEKTWTSRLVVRLEKRGLIRRINHPDDGRSWLVELTAKGRRECVQLEASFSAQAVNLLGCVPAAHRAGVESSLVHLRDALARCLVQCAPGKPR